MKYIKSVTFPSKKEVQRYLNEHYSNDWPFNVFEYKDLDTLFLSDITIFYGNNGSGKSTILNCLCEKIGAARNKPVFKDKKWKEGLPQYYPFLDYVESILIGKGEDPETGFEIDYPMNIRLITSDDIFTKINNIVRNNNISMDEIDLAHDEYFKIINEGQWNPYLHQLKGLEDVEDFRKRNKIKSVTASKWIKEHSREKLQLHSNGETAIKYFEDMFEPDGLYLLDEPENCLSPVFQIELVKLILTAKRYLNCQFIIATHSPLILSIPDAKVFDLDESIVKEKPWYELENVKVYFNFFYANKDKFLK